MSNSQDRPISFFRVALAFLIVPFIPHLYYIFGFWRIGGLDAFGGSSIFFSLLVTQFRAHLAALVFGVPILFVAYRYMQVRLFGVAVTGAILNIASVIASRVTTMQGLARARNVLGPQVSIPSTSPSLVDAVLWAGALGALAGVVFWLIALWRPRRGDEMRVRPPKRETLMQALRLVAFALTLLTVATIAHHYTFAPTVRLAMWVIEAGEERNGAEASLRVVYGPGRKDEFLEALDAYGKDQGFMGPNAKPSGPSKIIVAAMARMDGLNLMAIEFPSPGTVDVRLFVIKAMTLGRPGPNLIEARDRFVHKMRNEHGFKVELLP